VFAAHGMAVIDLREAGIAESIEEDDLEAYATFEENALAKAKYFHERSRMPSVASGEKASVPTT